MPSRLDFDDNKERREQSWKNLKLSRTPIMTLLILSSNKKEWEEEEMKEIKDLGTGVKMCLLILALHQLLFISV